MNTRSVLVLTLFSTFLLSACVPRSEAADYGTKAAYKKGVAIQFPDFVLTFVGERQVSTPTYLRGFHYHDFEVTAGNGKQTVSWSAGTGDIGPALFRVGARQYALELSRSDKLGPLKANEVVVNRVP